MDRSTAAHIIRRLEYGASKAEVDAIVGPTQLYFDYGFDQLAPGPEGVESADLCFLYSNFPTIDTTIQLGSGLTKIVPDLNQVPNANQPINLTIEELSEVNLALALTSPNQLREKMTQFWQKHFTTNYGKNEFVLSKAPYSLNNSEGYAAYFEWKQNAEFRANALGTFRQLLETSARGQAMLIYLDGILNQNDAATATPNQNYGRELLELHTLGVENWAFDVNSGEWFKEQPYTFQDIKAMSRVFSGFFLEDISTGPRPQYEVGFDGSKHFIEGASPGTVTVFTSNFYTPGGLTYTEIDPSAIPVISDNTEATAVLDFLATHPHTRLNVISALWRYIIGGEAPSPDNATMTAAFVAWGTDGNIAAVLEKLLGSPEFLFSTQNRWNQARLPMEVIGQMYDGFNGVLFDPSASVQDNQAKLAHLRTVMEEYMGRFLFRYPAPDGFPFESEKQLTSMRLMGANRLRQEMYSKLNLGTYPFVSDSIGYDTFGLMLNEGVDIFSETGIADYLCTALFADDHNPFDESYLWDMLSRDVAGGISPTSLLFDFNNVFPDYVDRLSRALAFAASLSLNNLK